jgi:hypothetical protein
VRGIPNTLIAKTVTTMPHAATLIDAISVRLTSADDRSGSAANARLHLLPEACAQRTLEAGRCEPLLGVAQGDVRCPR